MTDVFFSYKAEDRDRVRPAHDALEALGFDVFWDQKIPPGLDWDLWIKDHLKRARAAVVFWSRHSLASNNVRQEATISQNEGKLIQVMLEPMRPEQFPMGLYNAQAVDLSAWGGDPSDGKWLELMRDLEVKVTPRWINQRVLAVEAALKAERQKREAAEARERALDAQLQREIAEQQTMREERDVARRELQAARLAALSGAAAPGPPASAPVAALAMPPASTMPRPSAPAAPAPTAPAATAMPRPTLEHTSAAPAAGVPPRQESQAGTIVALVVIGLAVILGIFAVLANLS